MQRLKKQAREYKVMEKQRRETDATLEELKTLRSFKRVLDHKLAEAFRDKLKARFKRWYAVDRGPRLAFLARLVDKTAMYPYVTGKGLDLPKRYADVASLDEVEFTALPNRLVIKPSNGSACAGVMLFVGDKELFSGDCVPITSRSAYAKEKLASSSVQDECRDGEARIIIEEFVQDCDPAYAIPRDFKVYVAGGKARLIQVINRNGPKKSWSNSFYSRDWEFINQEVQTEYRHGPQMERPEKLDDLIAAADLIAADLQCFYRLDFYMAARGPVFGEFTSYPFGGMGFTSFGRRLMCNLMDAYPDAV